MGGDLESQNARINSSDNFHRVYSVNPVHLPAILNTCDGKTVNCTIETLTVTENIYMTLNEFDTGSAEISATELKVKLKSRQAV
jgi:hypothetical protein